MNLDAFIKIVSPYTMTSRERITDLYHSLEYVRKNRILGDFVECGVWKGGNILGIMEYLSYYHMIDRKVWLYDTFGGLTKPTELDHHVDEKRGNDRMEYSDVLKFWEDNKKSDDVNDWCYADLDSVKKILSASSFPKEQVRYVVGDIVETLKDTENIPDTIALLRLDTDWYESTKAEMEILYPRVFKNGPVIIDDYGCWQGCRVAVNEYFETLSIKPGIHQIDDTGVRVLKE